MTPEKLTAALQAHFPHNVKVLDMQILKFPENEQADTQTLAKWQATGFGQHKYGACFISPHMTDKEIMVWAADAAMILGLSFREPSDATRAATISRATPNGSDSQHG